MNRDELAALARAAFTLTAGVIIVGALAYAIGCYLGWWVVGLIALAAIGAGVRWVLLWPRRMMPW